MRHNREQVPKCFVRPGSDALLSERNENRGEHKGVRTKAQADAGGCYSGPRVSEDAEKGSQTARSGTGFPLALFL